MWMVALISLQIAGQGFVHGVVHDLVDEVVKAGLPGGADVHGGPNPHRFEPFEDADLRGPVGIARLFRRLVLVLGLVAHEPPSKRSHDRQRRETGARRRRAGTPTRDARS